MSFPWIVYVYLLTRSWRVSFARLPPRLVHRIMAHLFPLPGVSRRSRHRKFRYCPLSTIYIHNLPLFGRCLWIFYKYFSMWITRLMMWWWSRAVDGACHYESIEGSYQGCLALDKNNSQRISFTSSRGRARVCVFLLSHPLCCSCIIDIIFETRKDRKEK